MITTNEQKKTLISKLLEDKHITYDDSLILVQEPDTEPLGPGHWSTDGFGKSTWHPWNDGKVYVGDFPGTGTGGITNLSGTCTTTDTVTGVSCRNSCTLL